MSTYQYQPIATQEQPMATQEPGAGGQEQQEQEPIAGAADEVAVQGHLEPELPYATMMADEDIVIGEYRAKWGLIRDVLDEKGLAHTDENVIGMMLHAIMARQE